MKIVILTMFLLLSFAKSQVSICVCNLNANAFVQESCMTSCSGNCSKRTCDDYEYADSDTPTRLILLCLIGQLRLPIAAKNLCEKPRTLFGCFKTEIDPDKKHPKPVPCSRTDHDFTLYCHQNQENLVCQSSSELKKILKYDKNRIITTFSTDDYFWSQSMMKKYYMKLKTTKNRDASIEKIRTLAQLAEEIYTPSSKFIATNLESRESIVSKENNILGSIGYNKELKAVIVVFRGTIFSDSKSNLNAANLKANLKFSKVDIESICTNCKIHKGYNLVFESIKENFMISLNTVLLKYPFKIIFTGHSLGGALTTLALTHYSSIAKNYYPFGLVTFGSPRVGNFEFSNYINQQTTSLNLRVTFRDDPVVCIPLSTEYYHAGFEVNFQEYFTYTISDSPTDKSCIVPNLFSFGDHSKYKTIAVKSKLRLKRLINKKKN